VGGGDGLLHAVDANTGAHLYKFRCPDETVNSDFWWQRNVTVDVSAKRLYVASYGSLFCLEAVR
jgi:outer membrane protein assembly factor BamB